MFMQPEQSGPQDRPRAAAADIVSSVNELRGTATRGSEAERRRSEAAGQLLAGIGAVRRAIRRAARQAWPAEVLPQAESELLRLTGRRPGLSVAEAADELLLAPNTVSTLVGKLSGRGLLERGRSAADGRSLSLRVTGTGRQYLSEWKDLRAELAGRAFAGLDEPDRQALAAAGPALLRLAARLEAR